MAHKSEKVFWFHTFVEKLKSHYSFWCNSCYQRCVLNFDWYFLDCLRTFFRPSIRRSLFIKIKTSFIDKNDFKNTICFLFVVRKEIFKVFYSFFLISHQIGFYFDSLNFFIRKIWVFFKLFITSMTAYNYFVFWIFIFIFKILKSVFEWFSNITIYTKSIF